MIKVTKQEFVKRYDALPEGLSEIFLSDENINMLLKIGEVHHLSEDRTQKIAGVVGYIVLGLVHIEDLAKEIAIEAGVDRRLAKEIAREIELKILNPIIPQLQQLYHYGSAGTVAPPAGTAAAPPQPAIMRPVFAPGGQETSVVERSSLRGEAGANPDTPFILHEEQKETEQARPNDEALVRPSFYEETRDRRQETSIEKPTAARLEIGPSAGSGQGERREPRVGKTEEPPIRVVHYSGPQTPVDPFGSQTPDTGHPPSEAEDRKTELPRDIHPENIVDLKDLPK
ncbi:MAG: hypothetical protein Q8P66_02980 [Candidatus Colwellbacteria bacterium]|nr:hypothetical protein [Candidatus Colwellbacteria bacterium]